MDKNPWLKKLWAGRFVLAVLAVGLALLLLPTGAGKQETGRYTAHTAGSAQSLESTGVSLEREAEKLAALLGQISGVGRSEVLLSRSGAVVVCDGAENAETRLKVTGAVMAYTGLGSDKITVLKMK